MTQDYNKTDVQRLREVLGDSPAARLLIELEALRSENDTLRGVCAEAYQVIGAGMLGTPCAYRQSDVERALDNLSAGANGDPIPHADLLPWPKQ